MNETCMYCKQGRQAHSNICTNTGGHVWTSISDFIPSFDAQLQQLIPELSLQDNIAPSLEADAVLEDAEDFYDAYRPTFRTDVSYAENVKLMMAAFARQQVREERKRLFDRFECYYQDPALFFRFDDAFASEFADLLQPETEDK